MTAHGCRNTLFIIAFASGVTTSAIASAEPHRVFAEIDPLPFVRSGYGAQVGYRSPLLPRFRLAAASFSLDVPDVVAEVGDGNDGFHIRVRPSFALYGFYFLTGMREGWVVGGALRYIRIEYTHDDFADDRARLGEFSFEAIGGYKWHPFEAGFYVQPWGGLSRVLARRGDDEIVGDREYSPLPVQLFATVNLGWELDL